MKKQKLVNCALFTGAALLPFVTLICEVTFHPCEGFTGFDPLATPWHIAMATFTVATLSMLWLTVREKISEPAEWVHLLAAGTGVALTFCALFTLLAMNLILVYFSLAFLLLFFIIAFFSFLLPFLVFTPLFALMSGIALFRRLNGMAKARGVVITKSFCAGISIGLVAVFAFFATDGDAVMLSKIVPQPSWKGDAMKIDALLEEYEQGRGKAAFRVGLCYATGRGVAKDTVKAIEWYRKAFGEGYITARCFIGHHGKCGPDLPVGTLLCKRIAYRGDARFLFHQGMDYIGKDTAKAVRWLEKAATQGHPQAQLLLDRYYKTGTLTSDDVNDVRQTIRTILQQDY